MGPREDKSPAPWSPTLKEGDKMESTERNKGVEGVGSEVGGEPLRQEAQGSPKTGSEFRILQPGEVIQEGDFALCKGGSPHLVGEIRARASVGGTVRESDWNHYYRRLPSPKAAQAAPEPSSAKGPSPAELGLGLDAMAAWILDRLGPDRQANEKFLEDQLSELQIFSIELGRKQSTLSKAEARRDEE